VKAQKWKVLAAGTILSAVALAGCGGNAADGGSGSTPGTGSETSVGSSAELKGDINADGSSTTGPITSAVAEEFGNNHKDVNIKVGISGTGAGLKKFAAGEIDIANASRPIKDKEIAAATKNNIQFIELPVAYDGIAVVVNPKNTWAKSLTVDELKKIWQQGSKISNWSQVRAGFPGKPLKLFGPGTASGTYDYFVEEIIGKDGRSRSDYTPSEDDNALVEGVSRDEGALGYFGFAYYEQNKDKLKVVPIDGGKGAITPDAETIRDGSYTPLSRPLFIYVNAKAAARPEVQGFVKFYLTQSEELVREEGSVPLPANVYQAAAQRFAKKTTGSAFADKDAKGKTLEQLYKTG